MRIKNFTLMLMALLFSVAGFSQKSFTDRKDLALNRKAKVQTLVKQNISLQALAVNPLNLSASRSAAAKAPAKAPEVVTPPEGGIVENFTLTGYVVVGGESQSADLTTRNVKVVWDDENEDVVYISGLSYYLPDAFVKGTFVDEETVVFASGQYMGTLAGHDFYFVACDAQTSEIKDAVVTYDYDAGFEFSDILLDNNGKDNASPFAYWYPGLTIVPLEGELEIPVQIPNDLEIETYAYSAFDYFDKVEISGNLNIGIDGEDVYVQGMSVNYPKAWIKGTFTDETTVVFRSGQLLTDEGSPYFIAIDDNFNIVDKYVLLFDSETGNFEEGSYAPIINSYKDKIDKSVWQFYYGYEIKKITEQPATPAKSLVSTIGYMPDGDYLEFNLSKVDANGEGLIVEKLTYKLYYQDAEGKVVPITLSKDDYASLEEDLTEIPATLIDGKDFNEGMLKLNMEHGPSWIQIGIQGIYYGGEERNESEITWYTPTWPQTITLPEGLTVTEYDLKGKTNRGVTVERVVGLALDGDDIYLRGLGSTDKTAWVKGTKNKDGDYVFPKGQYMGVYYGEDYLFLIGYDEDVSDVVLTVDAANGAYEFSTAFIENADYTDKTYYVQWVSAGATITEHVEEVPEPVAVPENLVTETWSFSGIAYFSKKSVSRNVLVGFDGEDVYIQGLSEYLPEAWVKGTLEDDQITLPVAQYLGYFDDEETDLWSIGYVDGKGVSDYVMTYDAENFAMSNPSTSEYVGTTAQKNMPNALYDFYYGVTIKKLVEKAATPATPSVDHMSFYVYGDVVEFTIPLKDVDGDGLVADKLSYKLYYDGGDGEAHEVTFVTDLYEELDEDMTEIPYGFTDENDFYENAIFLNMEEHLNWKRIGIQSIYTAGGETNVSEIGWYTITWPMFVELPEDAEVETYELAGKYKTYNKNNQIVYVEFAKNVNVAKVGDEVYVQGVGRADSETWIKGEKNPETGVYTFAKGQYMGLYDSQYPSYCFLMGYNENLGVLDVKMTYNEEDRAFTITTDLVENADYVDKLYYATYIVAGARLLPSGHPDAIKTVDANALTGNAFYNIAGQRVGADYKGIVVKNGKKFFQK